MIKVVKTISAVLGIMICVALGGLGYFFYTSGENPQETVVADAGPTFAPQVSGAKIPMDADIGGIALEQPDDSVIASVQTQGALVYVHVRGGGLADRVVIVDLVKRRVVGHLTLGRMGVAAASQKP